ncbi:ATP-binding protein [Jiella sp. MQZ9-1]|uniref:histidine kinase n=1 Tax=Jiella flava TaxID=2816857 RepID=A0A939FZD4_9HYPH|nr:ATP-binding protein [Jiella flava]MBO0664380.1 HAMP domain-containing protein [Jiella flava]MCD2473015.1 ATP-binding protein [Jiella flava]
MPKGLYPRSLIIILAPMILLQCVVTVVFMERHWAMVTERLSQAVVQDVAAVVDLVNESDSQADLNQVFDIARRRLDLNVSLLPPAPLPPPAPKPFFNILDGILSEQITNQIGLPFWIDTVGNSKIVEIRIRMDKGILRVFARRNSAYASNTHIFLVWMVGTSLVLLVIAILFLRNQIRPIQALAAAAEDFGRGKPMPPDFRPRGASEVRRASVAFIQMRDRIERQIEQRTRMLNGVSHDLRTVLTRFRLQLALLGEGEDQDELNADIDEMQRMLEGYLAFAKGEVGEDVSEIDLEPLIERYKAEAALKGKTLTFEIHGDPRVTVRPDAFSRMIANLVANAMRHAETVQLTVSHDSRWLSVAIEDDGPGIEPNQREEVFKPFVRLDGARNLDAGGTGLGLAIARDIARAHGGDILLSDSQLGGLRALVRLPA